MKSIKSFVLERLSSIDERLKLNSDSKIKSYKDKVINHVIFTFSDNYNNLGSCLRISSIFKNEVYEWLSKEIDKYNYRLEDLNDYIDDGPEPLDDFDVDFDYNIFRIYFEFWSDKKILGWRREIDGKEDDWQYFYK